jgi:ABC-2 type transport system ATP-binding protein
VLLSSHLLNEVELIADEMVLIGRGRIVAQGDKRTLLSQESASTLVSSLDDEALAVGLKENGLDVVVAGDGLRVSAATVEVGRVAAERSIVLTDLRSGSAGLEDLFLELTSDTQRDTVPEGLQA